MGSEDKLRDAKYAMNTRLFLLMAGVMLIFNAVMTTVPQSMNYLAIAKEVSEYDGEIPPAESGVPAAEEPEAVSSAAAAAEEALSGAEAVKDAGDVSGASSAEAPADAGSGDTPADAGGAETPAAEGPDIGELIRAMNTYGITVDDLRLFGWAGFVMAAIRVIVGVLSVLFCNRVNRAKITLGAAAALAVCEVIYAVFRFMNAALSIGDLLYTAIITGVLLAGAVRMRKIARQHPGRVLALEPGRSSRAPAPAAPKKSLRERAMMQTEDGGEDEES